MYGDTIWDLEPEGGGPPMQVTIGNANEAIARHPERYTRTAPDGTPQAELAARVAERAKQIADIEKDKRAKLATAAKVRQDKLDAITKEQAEAKKAEREQHRAEAAKVAEETKAAPSREAEIQAIEGEATAAAALAEHESAEAKRALYLTDPPRNPTDFTPSSAPYNDPPYVTYDPVTGLPIDPLARDPLTGVSSPVPASSRPIVPERPAPRPADPSLPPPTPVRPNPPRTSGL